MTWSHWVPNCHWPKQSRWSRFSTRATLRNSLRNLKKRLLNELIVYQANSLGSLWTLVASCPSLLLKFNSRTSVYDHPSSWRICEFFYGRVHTLPLPDYSNFVNLLCLAERMWPISNWQFLVTSGSNLEEPLENTQKPSNWTTSQDLVECRSGGMLTVKGILVYDVRSTVWTPHSVAVSLSRFMTRVMTK